MKKVLLFSKGDKFTSEVAKVVTDFLDCKTGKIKLLRLDATSIMHLFLV